MKLICLALVLVWVKKVSTVPSKSSLYCRCTGDNCDDDVLDTCYTIHSCFTHTIEGNTTYGCAETLGWSKHFCNIKITTLKCCTSDLCNRNGLPPKPYLPVPSVKLASLVKSTVTVYIKDTSDVRAKIDGYVATAYVPGTSGRKLKRLSSDTRLFTFEYLSVNTTYVIEVTSYRGRLASERSAPVTIKTKSPECDYYKKGEIGGKKTESCTSFGCFSTWTKNGTNLKLQNRGCWNDVSVSKCQVFHYNTSTLVFCECNKRSCTPNTRT